jgi:hypothetical protein
MAIWYILSSFGTFFPVLVSFTKKNLATLEGVLFCGQLYVPDCFSVPNGEKFRPTRVCQNDFTKRTISGKKCKEIKDNLSHKKTLF